MVIRIFGAVLCLLFLLGGCATAPLPGAAGEISGPLRSIELYTKRTAPNEQYRTGGRDCLFASDRDVWVYLHWGLPGPGKYETKIALRTPLGTLYEERHYTMEAKGPSWRTGHGFVLPKVGDIQRLAGLWQVEVTLGGTVVGHRAFTFDPSSIRVRTDVWVVLLQGTDDPDLATGDWQYRNRFAALEYVKAAHAILGVVLRDELARRFPHVDGPRQQPPADASNATVLVRTKLGLSPNPDAASELVLDVVHVPTQTTRTFRFRSSAGKAKVGMSSSNYHEVTAADLAFQATASPEVRAFLMTVTSAVPE
jgi:hypothetical protein